ncbi:retrotransposable element Tf2 [Tanacetum coccineum]
MDDATRSFITETINAALAASIESINRSLPEQLERTVTAMNNSVNGVYMRQDALAADVQRHISETGTSTTLNCLNNTRMSILAKIKFHKFYGDDPTGWLYRCNQFFKIHGETVDWNVYVEALLKRFSSCYEDPMSGLKNIRQKRGLVQVYIDAFDLIMTKVDVPESQPISFFLGGLDKEIEMNVRMFKPQSLADAYCLSKLQETNNTVAWKIKKPLVSTTKPVYNNYARNFGTQAQNVHYNPPRPKPVYNNALYKKQLTQKDGKLFSLEIVEENGGVEEEMGEHFEEGVFGFEDNSAENVIINNKPVNILIDCGSTHNFLDLTTAKQMGCPVKESYPLQVAVPGGNFLTSNRMCTGLTWKLQGVTFQADFMLIPVGGCEMVLGVQWLSTLGDIVCNWKRISKKRTKTKQNGQNRARNGKSTEKSKSKPKPKLKKYLMDQPAPI